LDRPLGPSPHKSAKPAKIWEAKMKGGLSLLASLLALVLASSAHATVVNLDEFAVTLNGAQIFDDTFNSNTTFAGGTGTRFNSGVNFPDGSAAQYFVRGTITTTTANNGQATLNTAQGIQISLPDPFIPLTSNVQAFLQTQSNSATHLTPTSNFAVKGLFDFTVPAVNNGTYAIALTSQTVGTPGNELEARVRETASGPILQLAWLDLKDSLFTQIAAIPITAADMSNTQLELTMAQALGGPVTVSYAFGSGNTLATFLPVITGTLGTTDASTPVYSTNQFVLPGFLAFDPVASVPEASTWLMMLIGFAGLGFAFRQSRRKVSFA
jgi:hypothetical protein